MPVSPTYPGIYIEELPSSGRTITAASTSTGVFIGYTHPFKTKPEHWGKVARVFNFTEYEREFGGLYRNAFLDSSVAYAVQQFFLNGGSDAYIVPLKPRYYSKTQGVPPVEFLPAQAVAGGVKFKAKEPTDDEFPMTVTIKKPGLLPGAPQPQFETADIAIGYGSRAETFRRVSLDPSDKVNFIAARLASSELVSIEPASGMSYGQTFTEGTVQLAYSPAPPANVSCFSAADFLDAFKTDGALDKVDIFNLMAIPGVADQSVWSNALVFCERKRAFLIMDPPPNASADGSGSLPAIDTFVGLFPKSANGALYFPYLTSIDPLTGKVMKLPPSGFVAGVFARTDQNRGVWKAPAGLETHLRNATGVVEEGRMTDMRAGVLNPLGINCLRTFPGSGTVVFGARTLVTADNSAQQWRYVPVRRMALFIEQTLYRNLGWVVFEPNDTPLWVAIRTSIEGFMLSLFRQGAFQGATPSQAFQVRCDASTTTQTDIDQGIVNVLVGFRPLKPAEFVVIKISQLAGQVQA